MNDESMQHGRAEDPRPAGPTPEYPQAPITHPGSDEELTPPADHGEQSYKGLGRLRDRVALVTGGDSGIGRAVAIAFAREGADVLLSYLPEEQRDADETARWVRDAGRRAVQLPGDIRNRTHCEQMIAKSFDEFGRLDILVNNAAFQMSRSSLDEVSVDEFDRTFQTNVYALFWLCRTAVPRMQAGSAIVNTASIQAFDPSGELLPYAATKAAIVSLTKSLAQLAVKSGIRVNAVAPGPVWTPLIPSTMPPEKVKKFGANTLFGRAAQPVELAPLYVFLASNEARFVTGEVYGATGSPTPF